MLTVKHIAPSGAEVVARVDDEVVYIPADAQERAKVSFFRGSVHTTIDSGTVYVMNDHGKTIATYTLS